MKRIKTYNSVDIQNILIVNFHSTENCGDYALLRQTIYYLEKAFNKSNISIVANWPNERELKQLGKSVLGSPWWIVKVWDRQKKPRYQILSLLIGILWLLVFRIDKFNWLSKFIPKDWRDLFMTYKNSDLVVAVSGNQLFSSGRFGWPLLIVGFPIQMARLFKKKTIIFPQSVGPLNSKFERQYVRFLYNNVDKLYLRDLVSLKLIEELRITKSTPNFMHDIAFTYPPENCSMSKSNVLPTMLDPKQKKLGMTIIANMPSYLSAEYMQRYYLSVAKTIDTLIKSYGFDVFLFCQVFGPTDDENDNLGIERVMELLQDSTHDNLHIINQKLNPSQLKACYGLMDFFVASRLHSGIFSLSMGVPTLFIGYLYKTIGVLRAMDLEEYYIDLENISDHEMTAKIVDMWNNIKNVKTRIKIAINIVERDLARFPNKLLADMKGKYEDKNLRNHSGSRYWW